MSLFRAGAMLIITHLRNGDQHLAIAVNSRVNTRWSQMLMITKPNELPGHADVFDTAIWSMEEYKPMFEHGRQLMWFHPDNEYKEEKVIAWDSTFNNHETQVVSMYNGRKMVVSLRSSTLQPAYSDVPLATFESYKDDE